MADSKGRAEPVFVEFTKPVSEMTREELEDLGAQLYRGIQRKRAELAQPAEDTGGGAGG